jgi:hypothetical protein
MHREDSAGTAGESDEARMRAREMRLHKLLVSPTRLVTLRCMVKLHADI